MILVADLSSISSGTSSYFRFTYPPPRLFANRLWEYQQPYYGLLDRYVLSTDPPMPQSSFGTSTLTNHVGSLVAPRLQPRIPRPAVLRTWAVPRRAFLLRCECLDSRHHCSGWRGGCWRDHSCTEMRGELHVFNRDVYIVTGILKKSNNY